MIFFKDENNNIFSYKNKRDQELYNPDLTKISKNDAYSILFNIEYSLKKVRKKKENIGITVGGVYVQTDLGARTNLLGAAQLNTSINWKTENGFVELSPEQVQGIALEVGQHIQKCFNAEKVILEAHEQTPFTSVEDIEVAFEDAYNNL